jgi:hypothetical protein
MKYEILTKKGKTARIYTDGQLCLAIPHAKEINGKIIDRMTGKIIYNFCKEGKK